MSRRAALFSLALLSAPVVSQDGGALENVLVTGSYSPLPALTSSVSVIEAQQIRDLNKRTLAGLLKTLPGVLVEEQGGPGGLTAVSIRGGEANFTLVLLDGIPVNDPTNFRGGGFDFANLDSALVERIEVVRGAQSAIYGSDALAGVINIITRRPGDEPGLALRVEAGEDDYSDLSLSALGAAGNVDYTLEVARRDDGEPVPGSERDSETLNLRLGWRPAEAHALAASYRYLDGDRRSYPEQSGGPELALTDDLDNSDYRDRVFALHWDFRVSPRWQSRLRASRFEHEEQFTSPGIPPYLEVPPNGTETDFTRSDVQWVNTLNPAAGFELNLGADYRREEGESEGYVEFFGFRSPTDFDLDRDTAGIFASASGTTAGGVLLQGSVRRDEPEDFGAETSWQAGVTWPVGGGVSVSANLGEAFKLPSFFALGNALVGNPDLSPETAESRDAGLAWEATDRLRLQATWFHNEFRDLVDFDDATFRNVNRGNVQTSGVELAAAWQALDALSVQAQATYTDLDVKGEDSVLTGRPEWTAGAVLEWRPAARWLTALDYRYTGRQWAASRHTGAQVTARLGDFHRVDWVLQFLPRAHWRLQLSVDNLLDERYATAVGFLAPARALRIGLGFSI